MTGRFSLQRASNGEIRTHWGQFTVGTGNWVRMTSGKCVSYFGTTKYVYEMSQCHIGSKQMLLYPSVTSRMTVCIHLTNQCQFCSRRLLKTHTSAHRSQTVPPCVNARFQPCYSDVTNHCKHDCFSTACSNWQQKISRIRITGPWLEESAGDQCFLLAYSQ